jgi:SAM-dependent methyltransferase
MDAESRENYERWRRDGLLNIKPHSLRFGEFPEGWDVVSALRRVAASLPHERIAELGCGYGRLCQAFNPEKYVGVDINDAAIEVARARHPDYRFRTVAYVDEYPEADLYLAYTVFLHIPDRALREILTKICRSAAWIVIAEILDGRKHDQGEHCTFRPQTVYSRTKREYEELLGGFDFICCEEIRKKYHFYKDAEISMLIFRRADPPPTRMDIPDSLRNPMLEFEGIYDDGWAGPVFSVRLSRPGSATCLHLDAMLPAIDPGVKGCRLSVRIEGQEEKTADIAAGQFQALIPVESTVSQPRVAVSSSTVQRLPPPDEREISILLKSIGFAV